MQAISSSAAGGTPCEPEVTSEPLLLFNWTCPFVHRVTLALAHKQAHIQRTDIDFENKPAWLTKLSPQGLLPVVTYLEGGEQQVLRESLVLLHWVDEYYQGPQLLPSTPAERAKARMLMSRVDSGLGDALFAAMCTKDKQAFREHWGKLQAELTWLQQHMHPIGPFLAGSRPSLVDAAVAPFLLRSFALVHFRNLDMLSGHPRLAAYVAMYRALPDVVATFKCPGDQAAGFEFWAEGLKQAYTRYCGSPADWADAVV